MTRTADGLIGRGPTGWLKNLGQSDSLIRASTGNEVWVGTSWATFTADNDAQYSIASLPATTGQTVRPTSCTSKADAAAPAVQFGRTSGVLDVIQEPESQTVLNLTRNAAANVTAVTGGLAPITYEYAGPGGRLSSFSVDDFGSGPVIWSVVGGVTLPTQVQYSTGETLTLAYQGSSVTSATLTSGGTTTASLAFTGTGPSRVLTDGSTTWPTTADALGHIVVPNDTTAPTLSEETTTPLIVWYSPTTSWLVIDGEAFDEGSGVKKVEILSLAGSQQPTATLDCWYNSQCSTSYDLRPIQLSTNTPQVGGAPVTVRLTDNAGNIANIPAKVRVDGAVPAPVSEVMVANIAGSAPTKIVSAEWTMPEPGLNETRTVRWRKNSGAWSAYVSAASASLNTSATFSTGDTISLQFEAYTSLGGYAPTQSVSLTVGAAPADVGPPPSNARASFVGSPTNSVAVTVKYAPPYDSIGVTDTPVHFLSSETRLGDDGKFWLVTHTGTEYTDQDGHLGISELQSSELKATVNGIQYSLGSGTQSRNVTIEIPYPEPPLIVDPAELFAGGMNVKELLFCAEITTRSREDLCSKYADRAVIAADISEAYWTDIGGDSHKQNAHKHAYWNGLMERALFSQPFLGANHLGKWNLKDLQALMAKHEWYTWHSASPFARRTSVMDFHNNARGRGFGKRRRDWSPAHFCRAMTQWSRQSKFHTFQKQSSAWRQKPANDNLVYYIKKAKPATPPDGKGCSSLERATRNYEEELFPQ